MNTKLHITLLILIPTIFNVAFGQAPEWLWAKSAGESGFEQGSTATTDANGNVFVSGIFQTPSITFGATTLLNQGGYDIFLVKYDPSGTPLWATSFGGAGSDYSTAIQLDATGNIVISGHFDGANTNIGTVNLINGGDPMTTDVFIAKLDNLGSVLWAKSSGGAINDVSKDMCLDGDGNIFMTGSFYSSSATFDATTLNNQNNNESPDLFVVKYDSNGNQFWAISNGGTGYDFAHALACDDNGNIVLTGSFTSPSLSIGSNTFTNSSGIADIFVAKFNSVGSALWAKRANGSNYDEATGIAIDNNGNIYVTGYFFGTSITFSPTTLNTLGSADIFLVKYNSSGNVLWVKSGGGSDFESPIGVVLDSNGNLFISGTYISPSFSFEGETVNNNTGGSDIFVINLDSDGNANWISTAEGESNDIAIELAVDLNSEAIVTGYYVSSDLTFGQTTLTTTFGNNQMFVAKLNSSSVGLNSLQDKNETMIFPNPFSDQTVLKTSIEMSNANLLIINNLGQTEKIYYGLSGNSFTISKGSLSNGIYIYQLLEENEIKGLGRFIISD